MKEEKCSAVAEMGDRARAKWAEKWRGTVAVPLFGGQLWSLSNTMPTGPRTTFVVCTKWHLDPSNRLATIHQRYRQTGQRSRSIRCTITCNSCPTTGFGEDTLIDYTLTNTAQQSKEPAK